ARPLDRGEDPVSDPAVAPDLLADLTGALPARLRRRLEADPAMARAWSWQRRPDVVQVTASPETVVTLRPVAGRIPSAEQVAGSCLLAPRCLHVAAVASVLPIDEAEAPGTVRASGPPPP